jgi:protocatechuate 3,4-dioxygenase beta subunit
MVSRKQFSTRPVINKVAVDFGESIASEGKGEYMYVEGRVLTTDGQPIPNAVIDTWETDADG